MIGREKNLFLCVTVAGRPATTTGGRRQAGRKSKREFLQPPVLRSLDHPSRFLLLFLSQEALASSLYVCTLAAVEEVEVVVVVVVQRANSGKSQLHRYD